MNKRRNPSFWLYVIGIYILLQFFWWAWLLIDQSSEIVILSNLADPNEAITRRTLMVIGEGLVFILILAFGFFKLNQAINKEVHLAHAQRNFLLSVTHELNTPIATVKLYLETLFKRKLDQDKQKEVVLKSLAETNRLKGLVDNILTSARIEENQVVLHPQVQEVKPMIQQVLAPHMESLGQMRFNLIMNDGLRAAVDPIAIQSIFSNLVENAIKYDPSGSTITISAKENKGSVEISVEDLGIGIDPKESETIFSKFYRVQSENTRSTKGTGLGLYIARSLVGYLNGQINYSPNSPKGSIFTVQLPKTL